MRKNLWKRLVMINRIKITLRKLREKKLLYSEKKLVKEVMEEGGVSERTAKEYIKAAQDNPVEQKAYEEQSSLI